MLATVPDALSQGYSQVSLDPFITKYGADSVEFHTANMAQGALRLFIHRDGHPADQILKLAPKVDASCRGEQVNWFQ